MKPQPICPTGIRPAEYFTVGNTLYLVQLDGSIFDIEIHSVPTNDSSFYYKVGSNSITPCKFNSPSILSVCELLWVQKILKEHPEINLLQVLVSDAQKGDVEAIIFTEFILKVQNLYKSSNGYQKDFVGRLVDSLREANVHEEKQEEEDETYAGTPPCDVDPESVFGKTTN